MNIVLIFKDKQEGPGNSWKPVSLIASGGSEKHLEDNTVIGHSQNGGKSCLSNLIFF